MRAVKFIKTIKNIFARENGLLKINDVLANQKAINVDLIKSKKTIHLRDVPQWQYLITVKPRVFQYGKQKTGDVGRQEKLLQHLKELVVSVKHEDWQCDIQDVEGLSNSKSDLWKFSSLDELVKTNSKEMICEITEEKLQWNLEHPEIRILNRAHSLDHFIRHQWDGRLFLENAGGSHHFAAARFIASKLNKPVPLKANLIDFKFDKNKLEELRDYSIYLINSDVDFFYDFSISMESYKCTFITANLPEYLLEDTRLIILDNKETKSKAVIDLLETHKYLNLSSYWAQISNRITN